MVWLHMDASDDGHRGDVRRQGQDAVSLDRRKNRGYREYWSTPSGRRTVTVGGSISLFLRIPG